MFSTGRFGVGYNTELLETILKEELGTEACMNDVRYPKSVYIVLYLLMRATLIQCMP